MSDDEIDEGYNEFIKEYGSRYEWDNEGNPEFIPEWEDWEDLFCEIKIYWKTKAVRHWREKTLKRFVYSLPSVRNPTSLFHVLLQSDAIYLPQILSLIELPAKRCNDIVKLCKGHFRSGEKRISDWHYNWV